MENYLGDLADIIRASNGTSTSTTTTKTTTTTTTTDDQLRSWDFGSSDTTTNSTNQQSYELRDLYTFPDPLLSNCDTVSSPGRLLDMGARDINNNLISRGVYSTTPLPSSNMSIVFSSKMVSISPRATLSNSNNISVKLPIQAASPNNKVDKKSSFGFMTNEVFASCSGPKDGFIGGTAGLEIPSSRNSVIKRRKSLAKKVVCIPAAAAAAAANSRQTGEVVPSDLWAWRKYGQKPIKGSPFPRGYYRCSSSKGCSARKQVERSRTDPNMLVITYTSEHNHPWRPTQRNALAGSSRSQPSKLSSQPQTNDDIVSSPSLQEDVHVKKEINKEVRHDDDADSGMIARPLPDHNARGCTTTSSSIKDETWKINAQRANNINEVCADDYYRRTIMSEDNCGPQSDQDFFKDFIKFEGDDPLNLLFNQETKGSDPFSGFFDW